MKEHRFAFAALQQDITGRGPRHLARVTRHVTIFELGLLSISVQMTLEERSNGLGVDTAMEQPG